MFKNFVKLVDIKLFQEKTFSKNIYQQSASQYIVLLKSKDTCQLEHSGKLQLKRQDEQ